MERSEKAGLAFFGWPDKDSVMETLPPLEVNKKDWVL